MLGVDLVEQPIKIVHDGVSPLKAGNVVVLEGLDGTACALGSSSDHRSYVLSRKRQLDDDVAVVVYPPVVVLQHQEQVGETSAHAECVHVETGMLGLLEVLGESCQKVVADRWVLLEQTPHRRFVDEADDGVGYSLRARFVGRLRKEGSVPDGLPGLGKPDDDGIAGRIGFPQGNRAFRDAVDPQARVALVEDHLSRPVGVASLGFVELPNLFRHKRAPLGALAHLARKAVRGLLQRVCRPRIGRFFFSSFTHLSLLIWVKWPPDLGQGPTSKSPLQVSHRIMREPRADIKPKGENMAAGVDGGLGLYDGVQRLGFPAGQVLAYRGHQAPGVFVFLSGCIRSGACVWRSNDAHQPFLVPEVSDLDSPLPENVTIEEDATALFVPRSVVHRELSVQQLLQILASEWFGPELERGGIIRASSDASRNPLIIRKGTTFGGDGDVSIERTVHCSRQSGTVTVAECLRCDHCERIVRSVGGEPSELVCDYGDVCVEDLVAASSPPVEAAHPSRVPVSAIMTSDVVCVQKDLSVEALTNLFLERDFSGAPVVDESGRPIGLVSKTDLVRERHDDGGLEEREPLCVRESGGVEYELGPGFHAVPIARATVADIMMPIVFSLPENATVAKASSLMVFEGVHRLPVVSSGGQVVGILSSLDILCWLASTPVGSSAAPGEVRTKVHASTALSN